MEYPTMLYLGTARHTQMMVTYKILAEYSWGFLSKITWWEWCKHALLFVITQEAHNIQGIAVGAVLSDYQRVRVENVCSRLGLTSLAYLWSCDQMELLDEMINCDMQAVLVKTACIGERMLTYFMHKLVLSDQTCPMSVLSDISWIKVKCLILYCCLFAGLDPSKHLNKSLKELEPHLKSLVSNPNSLLYTLERISPCCCAKTCLSNTWWNKLIHLTVLLI